MPSTFILFIIIFISIITLNILVYHIYLNKQQTWTEMMKQKSAVHSTRSSYNEEVISMVKTTQRYSLVIFHCYVTLVSKCRKKLSDSVVCGGRGREEMWQALLPLTLRKCG